MADLDVQPKKSSTWWIWVLLIIIAAALFYFFRDDIGNAGGGSGNGDTTAVTKPSRPADWAGVDLISPRLSQAKVVMAVRVFDRIPDSSNEVAAISTVRWLLPKRPAYYRHA